MTKKVFRLNIFQFVIDNFIMYVLLLQGLIFIFVPIVFTKIFSWVNLNNVGIASLVAWIFISLVISLMVVVLWGYYLKKIIFVEINSKQIRFTDRRRKNNIVINLNEITKVTPRDLLLDPKSELTLEVPKLSFAKVLRDSLIYQLFGLFAYRRTETAKLHFQAKVDKYGGGQWEDWYGLRWLEIETKNGKQALPMIDFDSKTRKEIVSFMKQLLS